MSSKASAAASAAVPLEGHTAMVTGAAGGIGRGIAMALAEAGADLVLVDLARDGVEEVAESISRLGRTAAAFVGDVTDAARLSQIVDEAASVDILVNSAGLNEPQPFTEVDAETFQRMFAINVAGAFFASQTVARSLISRGDGGSILNLSSQMGHVGAPNRVVYCATKHAVEGITKAMAVELAGRGIRVNAIAPTYVTTPLTAPFFEDEAFRRDIVSRIPAGRIGEVADLTAAAVFLSSSAASLITGTSLVIDGGYTAQ